MSGEQEIHANLNDGNPRGASQNGPGTNIERLQHVREEADAFEAAASRAYSFARHDDVSARDILRSIRNTGGQ